MRNPDLHQDDDTCREEHKKDESCELELAWSTKHGEDENYKSKSSHDRERGETIERGREDLCLHTRAFKSFTHCSVYWAASLQTPCHREPSQRCFLLCVLHQRSQAHMWSEDKIQSSTRLLPPLLLLLAGILRGPKLLSSIWPLGAVSSITCVVFPLLFKFKCSSPRATYDRSPELVGDEKVVRWNRINQKVFIIFR